MSTVTKKLVCVVGRRDGWAHEGTPKKGYHRNQDVWFAVKKKKAEMHILTYKLVTAKSLQTNVWDAGVPPCLKFPETIWQDLGLGFRHT